MIQVTLRIKSVKLKDFIIIPLNATIALWAQQAKQHGVSEILFSLQP